MSGLHYIGVDIGGTNLRFALVAPAGRIVRRSRVLSGIAEGRQPFCARLLAGIGEMSRFAASSGIELAGVGVGVPGLVRSDGLICSSVNMQPLNGFNLTGFLEGATGLPVVCGNDANAIGMGEYIYGAGRGYSSFAVISIGTGLGSALILDGKLWTGADGFASEFGHVTVDRGGRRCPCGNRGCLEQYVSAGAIVRLARESGLELSAGDGDWDAGRLAALARQGVSQAMAAFRAAGGWLGIALASLVNTLNLQAVVVCGGVSESLDLMLPELRHELDNRCFRLLSENLDLLPGKLGDDAGLLGAAGLVSSRVA